MENKLKQIAERIKESRHVAEKTPEQMAEIIGITPEAYLEFESGEVDFSFTFLFKCAKIFGVDVHDLLTGENAKLSTYQVVRNGNGFPLARRKGFSYNHLAVNFKDKLTEPFLVSSPYINDAENKEIHLSSHRGVEFNYILEGKLKVQIGNHIEILEKGDSIYYNSETPHGMLAIGGEKCDFLAILTDDHGDALFYDQPVSLETTKAVDKTQSYEYPKYIYEDYIDIEENEDGSLKNIEFKNPEKFNFAFDVVDRIGTEEPDRLAMIYVDNDKNDKRFTFGDMKTYSAKTANYFKSLGIKKGDRVMLVLKRHYQFWFSILALHKLGAVAIPATNQLQEHDYTYRFDAAGVTAIVATADGDVANQIDSAANKSATLKTKIIVGAPREGWKNFNDDIEMFSSHFEPSEEDKPCGFEPAIMFFTSGTTGYPKIAMHAHTYGLGHFITGRYWHNACPTGIHFTISDTGWGKALWGKLYGQWMAGGAVFVYDFERFKSEDILPMFAKYGITTFCAPPTMYRFFIKDNLSAYDLSSLKYATVAGEALNPEVFERFKEATGLKIMEGFGQTETTLTVANLKGMEPKPGSMGKPSPMYDIDIINGEGNSAKTGEVGEIIIRPRSDGKPQVGLFLGYYNDKENTEKAWEGGIYHTGDTAWRDEDGYFWYVGRTDDLIKSSGYRIGPFEIESVIMELPYVLEVAVTGVPDPIRGQVVKATIVLVKGKEPATEEAAEALKKEIQNYVKEHTAPYKYPRVVDFVKDLPKTISGKIIRKDIK